MTPKRTGKVLSRWPWLLAMAFLAGLVVLAPAALIETALNRSPSATLQFSADSGSVWRGSGRVVIVAAAAPLVIPVSWRFDALALLRLRLGYQLQFDAPALVGSMRIGLRWRDIELSETALDADARLLSLAYRAAGLVSPTGRLRLKHAEDSFLVVRPASMSDESWRVNGNINLLAEQLALGGMINALVGTQELSILGEGTTIKISVLRSTGPLKLEGGGSVTLTAPRQFKFAGFATAAGEAPAAFKQLGPMAPDGRQRIDFSTTW